VKTKSFAYLDRIVLVTVGSWATRNLSEPHRQATDVSPTEYIFIVRQLRRGGVILAPGNVAWPDDARSRPEDASSEDALRWARQAHVLTEAEINSSRWLLLLQALVWPRRMHCRHWGGEGGAVSITVTPDAWAGNLPEESEQA
jgi:hypothetical protein